MPKLELKHLGKSYGRIVAVRDVSLVVENGELLALLGPSGCGKTTTLRMIAGLEHPDAGEIIIDGNIVSTPNHSLASEKRGVGMVFQDLALWLHMSVKENVSFVLKANGKNDEQRVHELLNLVKLNGLENRMPFELSGGEQQRVAIARALASEPSILLMDEPLSNLDIKLKEKLRFEVKELQEKLDITMLYVTHDQEEALSIANRVAVMNNGKVEQTDTPEQIYFSPETEFVADFIGQTNILEGMVISPTEVETSIGKISCNTLGFSKTECVLISIRPESVEISDNGRIEGRIVDRIFCGEKTICIVNVNDTLLKVQSTPTSKVNRGSNVRLKISAKLVILRKNER